MDDLMSKRIMLALESLGSVVITDADGRYLYASAQRLANGGYRKEDLLGQYVRDVYPDTLVDEVLQSRQPVLLQPMMARTPNGRHQCFVSYYPLLDGATCLGCFIYTTFRSMSSAMDFSHVVEDLSRELAQTREKLEILQHQTAIYSQSDIIGRSRAIGQLKMEISMVARTASHVLILGETGTGKELVAHSIHSMSRRRNAPFVRVNCSAIPESLMESEFFGYEDGAFTGARKGGKPGKFERASGGSLFLDEINTLPISMQPKFLRVLQEGEIERVGGNAVIPVDTRVISACNTSLEDMVRRGEFRQDLYYRLNVVQINVPPLRERKEDIPLLVNTFVSQLDARLGMDIQEVHPQAMAMLMDYDWPGNIRELQNVVERAMNYAYEGTLMPTHFKFFDNYRATAHTALSPLRADHDTAEDVRASIIEALRQCGGNKKAAAQKLGWARSTLYEKMKKYQIGTGASRHV